jgi:hypothetical protein
MELVAVKEKCSFPSYIFKKLEEDNIIWLPMYADR